MTNPNNAIGTNGAFDGRTSPSALNDLAAAFTRGIVSGWRCTPKSGMTIRLGGSASTRDVALAQDNAGDKLTINNRSGAPVEITLAGAPSTNNRIDAIVAYVDNPSTGDGNTTDNPAACGIIAVTGAVAANPIPPTESQIRTAITTDGATGGVAYYVVLATIRVGTNVTTIGSGVITQGAAAQSIAALANGAVTTEKIADEAVTSEKIDWSTMAGPYSTTEQKTPFTWINGKPIYKKTVSFGQLPNSTSKRVNPNISNLERVVDMRAMARGQGINTPLPYASAQGAANQIEIFLDSTGEIMIAAGDNKSFYTECYVTLWYTKTTD
jgi:hypothetical protein